VIVMLVGPIDYWWNENWESPQHLAYKQWRDEVNRKLVKAGHLVFRPHEAFKGAWDERAQIVNDTVINIADCLINLTPPGVPAYGTAAEVARAHEIGVSVYNAPPDDLSDIHEFIVPLINPYGKVRRKRYSKS
jgi:hypothetical protein